ncbi:hypothetical protein O9K51_08657 [Purpureocillium lavendulum]|uniref:Arylamine N-acetyltransferase n=1 Tax=Purpureocillium lavendulum TaxID=1247861 RepID=A0AB34FLV6_9HYPO|nr:hypothetical protein O9K51_08657 [Purpureocillium lavendulum]
MIRRGHEGFLHPSDPLTFLTELFQHQLVWIPFETLSLHHSTDRHISLDVQDLFEKIVVGGHGGYCLETNTFFSTILGSLGFEVSNDAEQRTVSGTILLYQDQVKLRMGPIDEELAEKIRNEELRNIALRRHFGITLTDDERHAMRGFVSELD